MKKHVFLYCAVICLLMLFAPIRSHANDDLGALYERGNALGQAGNYAAAIGLFRQAAEKGAHAGGVRSWKHALKRARRADVEGTGAHLVRARRRESHPVALFNLGIYYDQGLGVKADRIRAIEYYKRSAKAGYAIAAFNAGQMLLMGVDMPVDEKEGMSYMAMAAKGGVAKALLTMGHAHENGVGGMRRDAALALEYYAVRRKPKSPMPVTGASGCLAK